MAKLGLTVALVLGSFLALGCGGGDESEEDANRAESSANCADVCTFWSACNNRELTEGECAEFCDAQAKGVSSDCLALYVERTTCEAGNLNCADQLGTVCEAEYDAYYACESGTPAPEPMDEPANDGPGGPGDNF